jgi:LysM repeat protein
MALAVVGVGLSSTRFADADQGRPAAGAPAGGSVVIVQPGDTLWSLAREVQPEGDIRPLVAQLSRAHGGSSLRAGERLVVPGR